MPMIRQKLVNAEVSVQKSGFIPTKGKNLCMCNFEWFTMEINVKLLPQRNVLLNINLLSLLTWNQITGSFSHYVRHYTSR